MLLLVLYIFYPLDILLDKFSVPIIILSITKIDNCLLRVIEYVFIKFCTRDSISIFGIVFIAFQSCTMIIAYLVIASSLILNTHLSGYNTLFTKVEEEEKKEGKKKLFPVSRKIFILMITHKF